MKCHQRLPSSPEVRRLCPLTTQAASGDEIAQGLQLLQQNEALLAPSYAGLFYGGSQWHDPAEGFRPSFLVPPAPPHAGDEVCSMCGAAALSHFHGRWAGGSDRLSFCSRECRQAHRERAAAAPNAPTPSTHDVEPRADAVPRRKFKAAFQL